VSGKLALGERILDRCNPILVREIQQAVNGRAFLVTVSASLSCIAIIAMMIAAGGSDAQPGRVAFVWTLVLFAPVALFVVPFQAFLSTRHEVGGGTAEHLLLTRLRPGTIVRGKLLAAMLQYLVYLSLFAPLIAMTFLLRGVDVPSIAILLAAGSIACLCATSFSVLLGAGSQASRSRALPYALLTIVLGGVTLATMAGMQNLHVGVEFMLRNRGTWQVVGVLSFPVVGMLALFSFGAAAQLTHAYENRSTPFRILSLAGVGAAYVWIGLATPARRADDLAPGIALTSAVLFFLFWLFSVTEESGLSPRMKTLVPRTPVLAMFATPFLPGGGRGLLHTWLVALTAMIGVALYPAIAGESADFDGFRAALLAWSYTVIYATGTRLLRARLPGGPRGTRIARFVAPIAILLVALLPMLGQALLGNGLRQWSLLHIGNPIWTITEVMDKSGRSGAPPNISILVLSALVVSLPSILRGYTEVEQAARRRRAL